MGIALPAWIVEAHNNVWVLAFYGVLFGVGLPVIVVRVESLSLTRGRIETLWIT
jgi:preprotein translocase subunit Sec63